MTKQHSFAKYKKVQPNKRDIEERVEDFAEVEEQLSKDILQQQASRCMDCGVAFCHSFGCPLANRIPDVNTLVYRGKWREALIMLHSTNNFPEITGKLCPALCEASCTLELDYQSVSIKQIEYKIVETGWQNGWIRPEKPENQLSLKVAIIGSGPTGMTAAQELTRSGVGVTVFEKDEKAGGLLRYGIPDFKLDKSILDRRLQQLVKEGVKFETGVEIGRDISIRYLKRMFDAVLFTIGTPQPKQLDIPGNQFNGITTAAEYLAHQNKINSGEFAEIEQELYARDKSVVIIGGGDTGSDCVGTAIRQGAKKITMIEILPRPPKDRSSSEPWPTYPRLFRKSSSLEEGGDILWNTLTTEFTGENGHVRGVKVKQVEWKEGNFEILEDTGSEIAADLVIQSIGFELDRERDLYNQEGLKLNEAGLLVANDSKIYTAGDCSCGPSLIVNTINEGRLVAEKIFKELL